MKQDYEPGLIRTFQWLASAIVIVQPVLTWSLGRIVGISLPPGPRLLTIVVPLLLCVYGWLPFFQVRLRRLFLPLGLTLFVANSLMAKYVALYWMPSPHALMLAMLLTTLRLWITMQVAVLFVGWQYNLFWTIAVALLISLIDVGMSLPFIAISDLSLPLFVSVIVTRLVCVVGAGVVLALLVNRQRIQRQALAEANGKLTTYAATAERLAVSQERIRLAQELHDTLAHSLSAVTVQLEAAEAIWDVDTAKARTMVDGALGNTRSGLTEARRALQALRAGPLEEVGLRVAVGNLARSMAARSSLELELTMPDELPRLAQAEEQCLYRVAQEALSNVARHARATHVRVALQLTRGQLTLTIADDGRGFDPATVNGGHYGLKGLRERAELVGATLDIVSAQPHGTTLTLSAPIEELRS
jgi:signal transduction histidine kinase